jgi:hypothetical protein
MLFAMGGVEIGCMVVLILTISILLRKSQGYFGRLANRPPVPPPAPRPQSQSLAHHLDAPDAMQRWEVEMHDIARDLSAQLSTRMSALQELLRVAQRETTRLEAAIALARQVGVANAPPEAQAPEIVTAPTNQAYGLRPAGAAESPAPSNPAPAAETPPDRRYDEIYTLADYGLDSLSIAKQVGSPVGEVELILSLRNRGR